MSESRPSGLPIQLLEQVDAACDALERAWAEGDRPRIEDYLPLVPETARLRLSADLVRLELEHRWRRGEEPDLEEYRQRFPAHAAELPAWLAETAAAAERAGVIPGPDTRYLDDQHTPMAARVASPRELPTRLLGEYELLGRLDSGGMGEVYRARHRRLDKVVALKLLPANAQGPHDIARFQREMKAIGALDHPNIVEAYDAGEHAGVIYLAMKLVDGIDLRRFVKQRGPLPVAEACELSRQAALGLHYLHERGLVHRDIKPSNLMRAADGTVKVLDLGLARWREDLANGHGLTATGHVLGTPDFLAPEQLRDAATADARADLYGLGGTLFYLLTGRAPFAHHDSVYAKLDAHHSELPPDVRTLRPDVPEAVAALVRQLLAKDVADRPQTAAEVATTLAALLATLPSGPAPVPSDGTQALAPAALADQKTGLATSASASAHRQSVLSRMLYERPWLGVAAVLLVLGSLVLASWVWKRKQGPPTPATPGTSTAQAPAKPIYVEQMEITLTRKGHSNPAGVLGDSVFDPQVGDTVTVSAPLSQPGYAFLIAFRPDGRPQVCFPEKENEQPAPSQKPQYGANGDEYGFSASDGTGLAAFALVVSRQPLPTFDDWWGQFEKDCPWKKEEAPTGLVFRANGEDPVDVFPTADQRSKGAQVPGKSSIGRLANWLHQIRGIETVEVIGFEVAPEEKP